MIWCKFRFRPDFSLSKTWTQPLFTCPSVRQTLNVNIRQRSYPAADIVFLGRQSWVFPAWPCLSERWHGETTSTCTHSHTSLSECTNNAHVSKVRRHIVEFNVPTTHYSLSFPRRSSQVPSQTLDWCKKKPAFLTTHLAAGASETKYNHNQVTT